MLTKNKLNSNILLLSLLVVFASCANLRVVSKYDSDSAVPVVITRTSYFWGLKQPKDIQTASFCPSLCIVTTKSSFKNVFFSAISFGMVVPQTLVYECCPVEPIPGEF